MKTKMVTFWIGSNESGVNILNENSVKYLNTENSNPT